MMNVKYNIYKKYIFIFVMIHISAYFLLFLLSFLYHKKTIDFDARPLLMIFESPGYIMFSYMKTHISFKFFQYPHVGNLIVFVVNLILYALIGMALAWVVNLCSISNRDVHINNKSSESCE